MAFPEIEKAVYDWFVQQKKSQVRVKGADVQDMARMYADNFYEEEFEATTEWLLDFQKRYCLITRKDKSKSLVLSLSFP